MQKKAPPPRETETGTAMPGDLTALMGGASLSSCFSRGRQHAARQRQPHRHLARAAFRAAHAARQHRDRERLAPRPQQRAHVELELLAAGADRLQPVAARLRAAHIEARAGLPDVSQVLEVHENEIGTNALRGQSRGGIFLLTFLAKDDPDGAEASVGSGRRSRAYYGTRARR